MKQKKKIDSPEIHEVLEESTFDALGYRTEGKRFENLQETETVRGKEFYSCVFNKVDFSNAKNRNTGFVDCVFDNCDFSNGYFDEVVLRRVVFKNCRMTGCDFSSGTLQDVVFQGCQLDYTNFNSSKIQYVRYQECRMLEGSMSMCKQSGLQFEDTVLNGTEFLQTSLKDVDFRTAQIDGIAVEMSNLKGSIMTMEQAAACAQLLGIIVKDEFH